MEAGDLKDRHLLTRNGCDSSIQKGPLWFLKRDQKGWKGPVPSPRIGTDRKSRTVPELGDSVTGHSDRDVRLGSTTDMTRSNRDVRSTLESRHSSALSRCPFRATSRHSMIAGTSSFDREAGGTPLR